MWRYDPFPIRDFCPLTTAVTSGQTSEARTLFTHEYLSLCRSVAENVKALCFPEGGPQAEVLFQMFSLRELLGFLSNFVQSYAADNDGYDEDPGQAFAVLVDLCLTAERLHEQCHRSRYGSTSMKSDLDRDEETRFLRELAKVTERTLGLSIDLEFFFEWLCPPSPATDATHVRSPERNGLVLLD